MLESTTPARSLSPQTLTGALVNPCISRHTENLGKALEEGHRVGENPGDTAQ